MCRCSRAHPAAHQSDFGNILKAYRRPLTPDDMVAMWPRHRGQPRSMGQAGRCTCIYDTGSRSELPLKHSNHVLYDSPQSFELLDLTMWMTGLDYHCAYLTLCSLVVIPNLVVSPLRREPFREDCLSYCGILLISRKGGWTKLYDK